MIPSNRDKGMIPSKRDKGMIPSNGMFPANRDKGMIPAPCSIWVYRDWNSDWNSCSILPELFLYTVNYAIKHRKNQCGNIQSSQISTF